MGERQDIRSIDVTLRELTEFRKSLYLADILQTIEAVAGKDENAIVGTVHVYLDEDEHIHLDFAAKATINPKIITDPEALRLTVDAPTPPILIPTPDETGKYAPPPEEPVGSDELGKLSDGIHTCVGVAVYNPRGLTKLSIKK